MYRNAEKRHNNTEHMLRTCQENAEEMAGKCQGNAKNYMEMQQFAKTKVF